MYIVPLLAPAVGLLAGIASGASTCLNYGYPNSTDVETCICPPGLGNQTSCSTPVCGGNIFDGGSISTRALATSGNDVSSCSCDMCQSSIACQVGYNASSWFSSGGGDASTLGLSASSLENTTMTCQTSPRVYASSQMSCAVVNPTLQAIFPSNSYLSISRTLNTSYTPVPNITSIGSSGDLFAQLWYSGVPQFTCEATACNQTITSNNGSTWTCSSLACYCIPGTSFCSGTFDLSTTINTLSGTLTVACDGSGGTCSFQQTLLNSLFGSTGLGLSGCSFGECIQQFALSTILGEKTAVVTLAGAGLSNGVIGGLAVVGFFVVAIFLLIILACIGRRQSRRRPRSDGVRGGVGIEWSAVSYSVSKAPLGGAAKKRKRKGLSPEEGVQASTSNSKVILQDLNGRVEPGGMLAILGPSGAGKSTFVDLLAGRKKSGKTAGSVSFFSEGNLGHQGRVRVGYVDQADVLSPISTVRESLLFAARLRLPDNIPDREKKERVESVISKLGLEDVADHSRIGGGEGQRRGISGGECRRVSIGLELIADPDILVLDEPTSGLDSVSAGRIVEVLRVLADDKVNPTTIIASIHQPSSRLYFAFSSILVLSRGQSLYFGPGQNSPADYFGALGSPIPLGYNVADHCLDIASDRPSEVVMAKQKPLPTRIGQALRRRHTSSEESTEEKSSGQPYHHGIDVDTIPLTTIDLASADDKEALSESASTPTSFKRSSKCSASFLTQLEGLCARELRSLRRDWTLLGAHIAVACILGVFSGGLYYHVDDTIAGFQNRVGSMFFLGSLIAFSSLSALYNTIEVRPLFLRERSAAYYTPTTWLLSRSLFDVIPLRLAPTIILGCIVYWMVGLHASAASFFKFLLILVLYSLGLTLWNFLLAVVIPKAGVAILLSSLFNLYLMVYAGFFVNLGKIPPVLRWLHWLDPMSYALEALAVNEVNGGLRISDTLAGVKVNVNAQLIMATLFGFGNNYYRDVLVLFAFAVGYGVLLVVSVWLFLVQTR